MIIGTSKTDWTPITQETHARLWDGKVWRKDFAEWYFGGYRILYAPIKSRIGREWLAAFGHSHATCNQEVVNMIDPDGSLRRAGLLAIA